MHLFQVEHLLNVILYLIKTKDITYVTLLTCFSPDIENQLLDTLTSNCSLMVSLSQQSVFSDQTERRVLAMLDVSCADSLGILNQSSNSHLFNSKYDWVLFNSKQFRESTRPEVKIENQLCPSEIIDKLNSRPNSDVKYENQPLESQTEVTGQETIAESITLQKAVAPKSDAMETLTKYTTQTNPRYINANNGKINGANSYSKTYEICKISRNKQKNSDAYMSDQLSVVKISNFHNTESKINENAESKTRSENASSRFEANAVSFTGFEEILQDMMILPNSNVEVVELDEERGVWRVFTLYKVRHNSTSMVRTLEGEGSFDDKGLRFYNHKNKSRRDNFNREPVRIVEVLIRLDKFQGWDKKDSMDLVDLYGWASHELLQCVAFSLNATQVSYLIDDYGWKHTSEAGSFLGAGGLIKYLSESVADTGSALLLRNDRRVYVNYAATVFPVTTSFLFRQPSLASVSNIYLKPFSTGLWLSTLVLLAFITVTLTLLLSLSHRYGFETQFERVSLTDVLMSVLGAICQQGLDKVPNSTSGRMTVLVTSITCLFLVTSYSANIVALIQTPSTVINSVTDLANSPFTVKLHEFQHNRAFLRTPSTVINSVTDLANSPFTVKLHEFQHNRAFLRDVKKNPKLNREAKYLYDKKLLGRSEASLFVNASTGIEKIRQPLYALLVALENFAYFYIKQTWREEEKCGLSELRAYPKNYMVLPVSKQSGYAELFAQKYILFREVGLIQRTTQKWLGTKPECRSGTSAQFVSIGIIEFAPALKIYAIGIAVALLVFAGELVKASMDGTLLPRLPSLGTAGAGETSGRPGGARRLRHAFCVQEARFRIPCA